MLETKNLKYLKDDLIIEDVKKKEESELICEVFKDKVPTNFFVTLGERLKQIDYNLYKETMNFICSHFISINNDKTINIDYFDDEDILEFPINEFPDYIRDFIIQVSESLQVSVDMPAVSFLGILAICVQGKYIVNIKEDWYEPLNLFCTIIAPPAERKSAVLTLLTKPLIKFEEDENKRLLPLKRKYLMEKEALENAKNKYIKERYSNKESSINIDEVMKKIDELKEVKEINLFTSDVTTEKLASLLADNNGKMAIISAESGLFDIMAGKYNQKSNNFDIYLQGHSGDVIRTDRVNREREIINNPRLTLLILTQPKVIEDILKNASFRGKGLLARILYSYPKSKVGTRRFETSPIDNEILDKYNDLIFSLLNIDNDKEEILYFTKEAKDELKVFFDEIENKIHNEYRDFSDWVGKLVGATARIAGLLSIIKDANNRLIEKDVVKSSIKISKYFLSNAHKVFENEYFNQDILDAKYILEYIKNNEIYYFKTRDILRNRRRFKTNRECEQGLKILVDRGYIYQLPEYYVVNPLIFK